MRFTFGFRDSGFNAAIADQNNRYDQLSTIRDPEFAALAKDGLQEELNASFTEMAEGPYEQLGYVSLQALHDVVAAKEAIAEIEGSMRQEAEVAALISPLAAERIRQLAETRLEADQELSTARTLRSEAQGLLAATNELFERNGATWVVPKLLADRALEAAAARTAEEEALRPPKPESEPAAWEAKFQAAVETAFNRLAEQNLVVFDATTNDFAMVTPSDIRHRSQSRNLATRTSYERLLAAGIIPSYDEVNPEPISVRTLLAMALFNRNQDILSGNSSRKQERGLEIIETTVDRRLAETQASQAKDRNV